MNDLKIETIKKQVKTGLYKLAIHAFERCVERSISPNEIRDGILSGEIIEDYPEDKYGPCCLIYGTTQEGRILHVQCSIDPVWIVMLIPLNPAGHSDPKRPLVPIDSGHLFVGAKRRWC